MVTNWRYPYRMYTKKHQHVCLWLLRHSCSELLSLHKSTSNEVLHCATEGSCVCMEWNVDPSCKTGIKKSQPHSSVLEHSVLNVDCSEQTVWVDMVCLFPWQLCVEQSNVLWSLCLGNSASRSNAYHPSAGLHVTLTCQWCLEALMHWLDVNYLLVKTVELNMLIQSKSVSTKSPGCEDDGDCVGWACCFGQSRPQK